jgi:hypothetical protein
MKITVFHCIYCDINHNKTKAYALHKMTIGFCRGGKSSRLYSGKIKMNHINSIYAQENQGIKKLIIASRVHL